MTTTVIIWAYLGAALIVVGVLITYACVRANRTIERVLDEELRRPARHEMYHHWHEGRRS